jgi:hypothetical protein
MRCFKMKQIEIFLVLSYVLYLPLSDTRVIDYRHTLIASHDEHKRNIPGIFNSDFVVDFVIVLCIICGK